MIDNCFFTAVLAAGIIALITCLSAENRKRKKRQREWEERRKRKGEEGELETAFYLGKVRGYQRLLHHVYVPKADGRGTTEIDLVMIHEKGIIVIENKNYQGYIYGREDDTYWTQVSEKREKRSFYNPVKQNQGHIRHLSRLLADEAEEEIPYLSVITFNDGGKLKRVRVHKETAIVTSGKKVRKRLRRRLRRMPRVFCRRQVDELYHILLEEAKNTKKVQKMHEKRLHRTV